MAIPKYIIEEIKHSVRLSEVLGGYMQLRRAGKEYHALCPFHNEKTPSFTISDEKGFYHCFGCGEHGDAISFLMKHDHMSYVEAINKLAADVGIEVPEERPEDIAKANRYEQLTHIMELAAQWYSNQLSAESGWKAREYIQKRGLTPQTVSRFRLGFAPADREGLKTYLKYHNITEKDMLDVGLLSARDGSAPIDKFRDRLMFPILSSSGKVIAFGGRLISEDPNIKAPKYLNSPETELFHKRSQFYVAPSQKGGVFNKARESGQLFVVEGYMDVIACVQAGIEEVVATLGTAFTEHHLQLLWRAVDEPIICLDGDSAGSRAMLRAAELTTPLLTPGKSIRFMLMPKGDDPDTLLKAQGIKGFMNIARQALPLHEALFNAYQKNIDLANPMKKAGLEKTLNELAEQIKDQTARSHMQRYLKNMLWQRQGQQKKAKDGVVKPSMKAIKPVSNPLDKLYQVVLKLILTEPQLLNYSLAEELLTKIHSHDETLTDLATSIQNYMEEEPELPLGDYLEQAGLTPAKNSLLQDRSIIIPKLLPEQAAECQQAFSRWLQQLDQLNIENEYQELTKTMHSGEVTEDMLERLMLLQKEIQSRKTVAWAE